MTVSQAIDPRDISIGEFDYQLPDDRIASHPLQQRDACRLMLRNHSGSLSEHTFSELPALLPPGALMICNNTRVINARLRFNKRGADGSEGAPIEIFCLEPHSPADYARSFESTSSCTWLCYVGNSKRWKQGALSLQVTLPSGATATLTAEREQKIDAASIIRFTITDAPEGTPFSAIIEAAGEIPVPPYLNRPTEESDKADYQTVFSRIEGSVAAPTAGLHFTPELLRRIDDAGIHRRELTLHVGAGTFTPVKSHTIGEHPMHSEFISVSRALIEELAVTTSPVIAVGTTSVRTLESLYHAGCLAHQGRWDGEVPQWYPYENGHPDLPVKDALEALLHEFGGSTFVAQTRIIIAPGYRYRIVDGIVTNFHQPRSTLLLLVSAFTGGDWRRTYERALSSSFRFLSYGDACLFL